MQNLTNSLFLESDIHPQKILVNFQNKLVSISLNDVNRIEAYGDYSKIITQNNSYVSNFGICILEEKLPKSIFLRIHRSAIINIDKIKELHKNTKSYDVVMQNNDVVRVSRGYLDVIKKITF